MIVNQQKRIFKTLKKHLTVKKMLILAFLMMAITPVLAQGDGAVALGTAATKIKAYVTNLKLLIYAVAAIVGLVGGLRIYNKWTNGDQDINKEVVGWGGAAVFVALVPTFVEAIFG